MSSKTKVEEKIPRNRAEGTVGFTVSAFPSTQWSEWDKDCKRNFGDCRWIKIWHDHVRAKDYEFYEESLNRIRVLEQEVQKLKGNKGESSVVETFTQKIKNKGDE